MAGKQSYPGNSKDGPGAAAFRVQNQIRRNAQDMQEYLTDLGSWEKSIKKKDKRLSRKATSSHNRRGTPGTDTPPIRLAGTDTPPIRLAGGTVPLSSGPAPQSSESTQRVSANSNGAKNRNHGTAGTRASGTTARNDDATVADSGETKPNVSVAGHTYDKGYSKWAKFDVDAALRSVDQEDAEMDEKRPPFNSSSSDSDTDGDNTQETPRLTPATMVDRSCRQGSRRPTPPAHTVAPPTTIASTKPRTELEKEERERGNVKFGQGDFEGAVKSYTRCVGMNSKSSLAFSNRAMAYLKLKEFGKAEADSDAALRVDPRHVKSLQRRAAARNALGKHRAALGDLQTAAEIDPSSKQVRKDLSKTLETLKTVVRRAPKKHVKVESAPLPAPKPRGYSPPSIPDEAGLRASIPASPDSAVYNAVSAVSATNLNAAVTGSKDTAAPFCSVLRESTGKRTNGETNLVSYQARTIVEELPEEEAALSSPPRASATNTNAVSSGQVLPPASFAGTPQEEREVNAISGSSEVIDPCSASMAKAAPSETTYAPAAMPPPIAAGIVDVEMDPVRPAISPAAVSGQGSCELSVDSVDAKTKGKTEVASDDGSGSSYQEPHLVEGKASSQVLHGKAEPCATSAPIQTSQKVLKSTAASPSNATTQALQQPTTGYQFEHMWRSTDRSPEARLELLRTVPPSSIAKLFRRTPIEVDLLGGILQDLGKAFLPRRPATALRWLKSLSKASRFSMTIALLGEMEGRAAAREVLKRLEAAPLAKVDPQDVDALRKQFLLC